MPSFAISKFTVLLGPLWVSAEFLLLSTGSNLDGTSVDVMVFLPDVDSGGTSRNVPPLLSHGCPRAGRFDGYEQLLSKEGDACDRDLPAVGPSLVPLLWILPLTEEVMYIVSMCQLHIHK